MNLSVRRVQRTEKSTAGQLWKAGKFYCFTLEPPTRSDDVKPRAIPAGTYDITIRWSPKFNRLMPHIENVPGFSEIMIHWGNFPQDTEGCLLVGMLHSSDFVGRSRMAFDPLFMALHDSSTPNTICFEDIPDVSDTPHK